MSWSFSGLKHPIYRVCPQWSSFFWVVTTRSWPPVLTRSPWLFRGPNDLTMKNGDAIPMYLAWYMGMSQNLLHILPSYTYSKYTHHIWGMNLHLHQSFVSSPYGKNCTSKINMFVDGFPAINLQGISQLAMFDCCLVPSNVRYQILYIPIIFPNIQCFPMIFHIQMLCPSAPQRS